MVGHGGSSAGSYLADPTSPIPSHCAVIILFKCVAVHQLSWLALEELILVRMWYGPCHYCLHDTVGLIHYLIYGIYFQTVSWRFLLKHPNRHTTMFVPMIEEKSSRNSLQINADRLTSEIFEHNALHWSLYHAWFQNTIELNDCFIIMLINALHNEHKEEIYINIIC